MAINARSAAKVLREGTHCVGCRRARFGASNLDILIVPSDKPKLEIQYYLCCIIMGDFFDTFALPEARTSNLAPRSLHKDKLYRRGLQQRFFVSARFSVLSLGPIPIIPPIYHPSPPASGEGACGGLSSVETAALARLVRAVCMSLRQGERARPLL
jgi:hypothetical protein